MPKCESCGQEIKKDTRTTQQNRALHLYFTHLAEELNAAGYSVYKTLKHDVEIDWTPSLVKELLWRPVQVVMTEKHSTTELDKLEEITKIYDTLNRYLGEKTGVFVPFPSEETQMLE